MSAPRTLRTALVLALLAITACDEPAVLAGPQSTDPSQPSTPSDDGFDFAVSTWPKQVLADFETRLEATPMSADGIADIEWRFADGTFARGSAVRHTFAKAGVTSVLMRARTATGQVREQLVTLKVTPGIAALASTLVGIVPGGVHTCAIEGSASLYCWGWNGNGNLGDGLTTNSSSPLLVGGAISFAQVATGFAHTCALTTAGEAYCWGRNYNGQLGDGTKLDRNTPTPVATPLTFASIDVGYDHSCAVTDAGIAYCWGSNQFGQLGDGGAVTESLTPRATQSTPALQFARAGYHHTCALTTTGTAYCWGRNNLGQIGDGSGGVTLDDMVSTPTLVTMAGTFSDLDAGAGHTCAISAQRVYCWGWNAAGQLGNASATTCIGGTRPCTKVPTRIAGGHKYSGVSAGSSHTCGVDPAGAAFCWGANASGQLGDGTTTGRSVATAVAGGIPFKTLRAGGSFTCGVSVANVGYCWGGNSYGKLGLGDTVDRLTPTQIPTLTF